MRQRQISKSLLKVAGVAIIAQFATACSSDILRFSDQPFGNPFRGKADTASTGAVNTPPKRIDSASLPVPPAYQPLPGNVGATGQTASAVAATQVAASPVTGNVAGWSNTGGSSVTIGPNDTIDALSNRYGVPTAALRAANGMNSGQPAAGTKFIIPAYRPGASAAAAAAEPTKVASTAPVSTSRSPRYEALTTEPKKAAAPAKAAERKPRYESLKAETKSEQTKAAKSVSRPVAKAKADAVKPAATKAPQKVAAKSIPKAAADDDDDQPLPPKVPSKAPVKAPKVAAEPKPATKAEAKTEVASAETTASTSQDFRWPARGRVISGYGSKGPGGTNDGINIAVPEGTPVKASEGGTVAYAGEEIKGYGKMVLIRHPNGYVSAYAHNGDLNVKRGDVVKRGQQIAKSGQTGNVTSPQLHFELRKGSDPVDPSKYLEN